MKTKTIQHFNDTEFGYFVADKTVITEYCHDCEKKRSKIDKLQTIVDIYEKANESILMWGAIYPEDIYPAAKKAKIEVEKIKSLSKL